MAKTRRFRRGIYLLPTLFTVGNIFCGYWSLIHTFRGALETAAVLIIVAGVLDGLDGRIARLTGSTSDFGVEFDSLADMVSFGVAPALLAYQWALNPIGRAGWLIAFLYVVCAAMRLARFNLKASAVTDRRFFAGLPSPSAAGILASVIFAFPEPPRVAWLSVLIAGLVGCLGLLMISMLRYYAFKDFDLRNRRSYVYVLPLAIVLVAVAVYPKVTLLLVASAYLLSAPTYYVWTLVRRARRTGPAGEVVDEPVGR